MRAGFAAILLFALGAHTYVAWRLFHLLYFPMWGKWLVAIVTYLLLALAITAVMGVWDNMPMWVGSCAYDTGNTWLIAFLYLLIAFFVIDVLRAFHLLPYTIVYDNWILAGIMGCALTGLLIYGNINYNNKVRQPLEEVTSKPALQSEKKIVMISDLHAGYHNRRAEIARWVDLINEEHADLVVVAGDIIDGLIRPLNDDSIAAEFQRVNAPIVACPGNHEYLTGIDKAIDFYSQAGIVLLRDSIYKVDGLAIIGRDDLSNRDRKPLKELVTGAGKNEYTLLIDHQPANLKEAEDCGIDFQFSGHTHHGQVWPLNLFTEWLYEDAFGPHRRGVTSYYVSSGLGIWGGKYRIATRSEYVVLTLKPSAP